MLKKIKAYFRNKRMTRQLSIALGVLKGIDLSMQKNGYGRQKRREYWRKFISTNIVAE